MARPVTTSEKLDAIAYWRGITSDAALGDHLGGHHRNTILRWKKSGIPPSKKREQQRVDEEYERLYEQHYFNEADVAELRRKTQARLELLDDDDLREIARMVQERHERSIAHGPMRPKIREELERQPATESPVEGKEPVPRNQ